MSPTAAAKILHAFAATRTYDEALFTFISARLTAQACAGGGDGGGRGGGGRGGGRGGGGSRDTPSLMSMPPGEIARSLQTRWALRWGGGQEARSLSGDDGGGGSMSAEGLNGEGGAAYLQSNAHTAQSVAMTMNAMAKLRFKDRFRV